MPGMSESGRTKPVVGITPGDPGGIGAEVVAKALATNQPAEVCRPVVIGSRAALEQGVETAGVKLQLRDIDSVENARSEPGMVDVFDSGALDPTFIQPGVAVTECGRANGQWLLEAAELAAAGSIDASVMAPVNGDILQLDKYAAGKVFGEDPSGRYLTLLSGPLRVVHVFDHVMLEEVCGKLSHELVLKAIRKTHQSVSDWGIQHPRIGVAGLNPHAHGPQEDQAIRPGVEQARQDGIDVVGPIAPDTVFRHCIDGRYDVVIAMFHDQGHIAVKTWGFVGNCALFLGAPYLFLSVGHGTAYDIVGQGIADHEMILAAVLQAANLASGRGFLN